ncbi:hypothetical protein C8R46DRAFT_26421 [Mycena filopes]|nr:hypothetical protein C8R46DRAFT_26421 [Mycena filopes]
MNVQRSPAKPQEGYSRLTGHLTIRGIRAGSAIGDTNVCRKDQSGLAIECMGGHTSRVLLLTTSLCPSDKPSSIGASPRHFSPKHPNYLYMAGKPSVYAASCNPPRSAKQRPRSHSESSSASEYTPEPRRIVPLSPKLSKAEVDRADVEASTSTAKRGRKPATMSRTAREAQRKLNHSIIEKARRTKINDALSTLKQLVPANYGQQPPAPAEQDEEEAEGDCDGAAKAPKKATGKREEKEKEFKLEILIRTVAFMQDLVERVQVLEAAAGSNCANCGETSSLKRKRSVEVGGAEQNGGPVAKRHETGPATPEPSPFLRPEASPSLPPSAYNGERLPSISSWLPESAIQPSPRLSPQFQSHLPSPPSSTQFAARTPSQMPPALSLGPIATQALLTARTPEDESAASLLLEISASSPTFREGKDVPRHVQTPASLLGLAGKT